MAGETTTANRDFNVQQLADTVRGMFADKKAFMGSILVSQGAVEVKDSMPYGPDFIGNEITIPYFGVMGEFQPNNTDGNAAVPQPLALTNEKAYVSRSSLAFEVTRWARYSGPQDADPYVEAGRQIVEAAQREMDRVIIAESLNTPLVVPKFNASGGSNSVYLDWDLVVDGRAKFRDFGDDIVAMIIHSRTEADLRKLKSTTGTPLLVDGMQNGDITKFCGIPLVVSNRAPLVGSSMGAVTAGGTSPVAVTIDPSTNVQGPWDLAIKTVTPGARGTWTFQFSVDGGYTWSAVLTSAATVALTDTAADSTVGNNGKTGIVIAIASGNASADNTWTSTAVLKATTLIVQKQAMAFWYNRKALGVETIPVPLKDSVQGAMHLYYAPKLYRRRRGGPIPGVVAITHNVRGYAG